MQQTRAGRPNNLPSTVDTRSDSPNSELSMVDGVVAATRKYLLLLSIYVYETEGLLLLFGAVSNGGRVTATFFPTL